ncbi:MAG: caspase family protein [Saprospiraceae bacterium]|nr:caspase family protein [Saprospiraceae bacterium]
MMPGPKPFSSSRAYLIGVSNYQYPLWQLETPLSDAEAMATLLREQHGFDISLLPDPTGAQIKDLLERIKHENNTEDARVLVYFAGHGVQRDSAYGLKGYFVPADAKPGDDDSMVPMELMSEALRDLKTRHLLVILDCCFAGTFRMPGSRGIAFRSERDQLYRQHFEIYCNFPSRLVLTSTSHRQKAFDRFEDGHQNSPFNRFLQKAICGEADYTRDRLVTATEIKTYLSENVSQITQYAGNLQSVGLDSLEGDGEGEFLFFLDGFDSARLPEQAYVNPYKGLQSYEPDDRALFFGRQKATQNLLAKLREWPFAMVIGASGTGKSSLVKAGLTPRLAEWTQRPVPVIRPGKHPLASLPPADAWDILVVDQWEELITQVQDEGETEAFYDCIRDFLQAGKRIIGTVRSDFEAQMRHEILDPWWSKGRFVVPPFTSEEYHDIIVQPAKRVACLFEDRELVQSIEQEVAQQPGPLPLLSFLLSELFEKAKQETTRYRSIRRSHYEAIGGVSGALRNKAETVYAALPDDAHRDTMRRVMLRMVALSAGEMAGRRVLLEELDYHDDIEDGRVKTVVLRLDEAKLIRRDADEAGRAYIEPAHDALVSAWRRLWEWVKALSEENLLLHAKLIAAVDDYRSKQSNKKFLWTSDPRLDQAHALMIRDALQLNDAERTFTESSLRARAHRTRQTRLIVAVVILGLIGLSVYAFNQQRIAQYNASEAQKQQHIAEKNLADFVQADSIRLSEEAAKERLNYDKYVGNGDIFANSRDYELALGQYLRADTIRMKFANDPDLVKKAPVLQQKIGQAKRNMKK